MTSQQPPFSKPTELNDEELSRYSRQILLTDVDYAGQLKLTQSHAVIFGLGGLGSPVSMYLAAAGIGQLTLVDFDQVDDSNLQRQIVHRENNIGEDKVHSAKQNLLKLNHHIHIDTINEKLSTTQLANLVASAQVVIDCTDNFASRYALNSACFAQQTPLVSGAAIRWEGQLSTYDFRTPQTPCYECLYPKHQNSGEDHLNCSQNGVIAPLVGMIGSMQALEAIKVLLDLPTLAGKLMIIDAQTMMLRTLNLNKDPYCAHCGQTS